jgi:small GTP-binding protein
MEKYIKKNIYKIIVFGESEAGKSTLCHRLTMDEYNWDMRKTIGIQFYVKKFFKQNIRRELQIWDFSGEKKFLVLFPLFLAKTSCAICCFDLKRKGSIEGTNGLNFWLNLIKEEFKNLFKNEIPIILCGNKKEYDIPILRPIIELNRQKAQKIASQYNYPYIETSSKSGENIDFLFNSIVENIFSHQEVFPQISA